MNAFLLLLVCFGLGWLVARLGRAPAGLVPALNWWVLNLALPALILELIPRLRYDPQLWFLIPAMWFVLIGAALVCAAAGRWRRWSRARIGALTLVGGLGNTAFTGYPLIEALRGKEALGLAVVADQLGGTFALTIGGITVAAWYSGGEAHPRAIARRILTFPPLLALVAGAVVSLGGGWPSALDSVFERIGATLSPLALFSVGMQFTLQLSRSQVGAVASALSWKLIAAPLFVWLAGRALGIHGPILAVAMLQAGMAPMISSAILADQYDLDPRVANAALGVGILISLLTVPLMNRLV
jgi:predicted permease